MALNYGNTACTTGLAGRIYSLLLADTTNGFSSLTAAQDAAVKSLCFNVAKAVVLEIINDAVVTVSGTNYPVS